MATTNPLMEGGKTIENKFKTIKKIENNTKSFIK